MHRPGLAVWLCLLVLIGTFGPIGIHASPIAAAAALGRRALLAPGSLDATSAACASLNSKQLLVNGYFNKVDLSDMHNMLLMASLANDVYPWSKQYNIPLLDVADGLDKEQAARFERLFGEKYRQLGATSIQFLDFYETPHIPITGAAAHAVVLSTPSDVFVAIRGTADAGQVRITGHYYTEKWTIYNTTLDVYYAPYASFVGGLWPQLLPAVKRATAATDSPSTANIYITGHSLGAASAYMAGLSLKEAGFKVSGVYAFDPYHVGYSCEAGQACWVSLYEQHLGDVTYSWWNNQDPIPQLLDFHFQGTPSGSRFGHVHADGRNWMRIVGDKCLSAHNNRLMEACPPEIDAADGAADGACPSKFGDHLPWKILMRIAHCALLQPQQQQQQPPPANARLASRLQQQQRSKEGLRLSACSSSSVWNILLGLPPPGRK
ncbi:hypothetical protein OEZ85_002319 [Tetradesmus obliquus]|uniref:Fungal lipase-type domain-containing protein n=1 Tax=Tetradesmus obliquus TaxID=3088 RepID=A0ABY8U3J1_TETOB|nr:hypothetical protein OEZ85_002319 [Tetradesmus obliquus]